MTWSTRAATVFLTLRGPPERRLSVAVLALPPNDAASPRCTAAGRLKAPVGANRFHLWQGRTLAEQAVKAGLVDWHIEKNR